MFLGSVADVYLDVKYDFYGFFTKGVPEQKCLIITNGRRYTCFLLSFSLYSNGFKFRNDTQASGYR